MSSTGFADLEQVDDLLDELLTGAESLRDTAFWRISGNELLEVGKRLEQLSRVFYAAQIHYAGEVDAQGLAAARSVSSTHALLRQTLRISSADAIWRVKAAAAVLEQDLPSGGEAPPVLPALGEVLDAGHVGPEQVKLVIETMAALPANLPPQVREQAQARLAADAAQADPHDLKKIAERLADYLNPDGTQDEKNSADKMELHFGTRSARTGLTPIKGQLDDEAVQVVGKAIDALAKPRPEADGIKDARVAATRRMQALVEALSRYLDSATGPEQGGERPHLSIVMQWDALKNLASGATFDDGSPLTPAQTRRFLCDATVIPAVLGGKGEILDVGRTMRTFPTAIRRALEVRDKGCAWPHCDRPAGWCEGHHINWWERDLGDTSLNNGTLLCRFHHSQAHRSEWKIRIAADGRPEFIPPPWIDREQKPRRNNYFDTGPDSLNEVRA